MPTPGLPLLVLSSVSIFGGGLLEGAVAQSVSGGECSIQSVFAGLTAIKEDENCRQGCNSNSGDCPEDWTPGSDDDCSAACGQVFEPFWVSHRQSNDFISARSEDSFFRKDQ